VDLILIGGQAINIWASYYMARAAELQAEGPFTSKDIDFLGDRAAVIECAERLQGTSVLPVPFEQHSPVNSGIVRFVDADGYPREIDFNCTLLGVRAEEVKETCVELQADGIPFKTMHPVLCIDARVPVILTLGRTDPTTLSQLRAAIFCAREFIRDLLAAGAPRVALDWIEHIADFALGKNGIAVYHRFQIDVLKAIPVSEHLPEKFLSLRFPRLRAQIDSERKRLLKFFQQTAV
jgi:hypothetical protein